MVMVARALVAVVIDFGSPRHVGEQNHGEFWPRWRREQVLLWAPAPRNIARPSRRIPLPEEDFSALSFAVCVKDQDEPALISRGWSRRME
jgi:hypothetical protein